MELYACSAKIKALQYYLDWRRTFLRLMGLGGGARPFEEWDVCPPPVVWASALTSLRSPSKAAACDLFLRDEAISIWAITRSISATPKATMPAWAAVGSEKNSSKPIVSCPIPFVGPEARTSVEQTRAKVGPNARCKAHCAFPERPDNMVDEILSGMPAK